MSVTGVLVANRGEIAIRILRAASDLGLPTVAVYAADDAESLHVRRADRACALDGVGAAAYLDGGQISAAALDAVAAAIHPGSGFLSEQAWFARRCAEAGLTFVGPRPDVLELFGDKSAGRALAERCHVPVLAGTTWPSTVDEAAAFLVGLGPGASMMIKAVAGGGGRGMRAVHRPDDVAEAYARCRSEAEAAFGDGSVFVERWLAGARHIEVQIVGDGGGAVRHLWERDCSVQRRHQKLVELAPAPALPDAARTQVLLAAVRMAEAVQFDGVGTLEFLVDGEGRYAFIEGNPRLQVEHTVTEEVTGVDLVRAQLLIAGGATLAEAGVPDEVPVPHGYAVQLRVNMETIAPDGAVRPEGGTLTVFEPPTGPGVRVDTFGYSGYTTSPRYDSLLAKVVVHSPSDDVGDLVRRAQRGLRELRVEGVATNAGFLAALLAHPAFVPGEVDPGFLEPHVAELAAPVAEGGGGATAGAAAGLAGARLASTDPLAVLDHGKSGPA